MRQQRSRPGWHVPVRIDDIPVGGRRFDLSADTATRAAVAKTAGVVGLPRLTLAFEVTRRGRDGLRVAGTVSATVSQTCVVTLEPVDNEIEEQVDLAFAPAAEGDHSGMGAEDPGAATLPAQESPEMLVNGAVDLGAIATEFLMLGVDPYPRKAGAVFAAPAAAADDVNPFAALAAIKKGRE